MTTLELLKNFSEDQHVMVKRKVINVLAVEKITAKSTGKDLTKKDFVLADSTSLCRCITWKQMLREIKAVN